VQIAALLELNARPPYLFVTLLKKR
jgi:hypothetical protein